jgi:hypothetical protein
VDAVNGEEFDALVNYGEAAPAIKHDVVSNVVLKVLIDYSLQDFFENKWLPEIYETMTTFTGCCY